MTRILLLISLLYILLQPRQALGQISYTYTYQTNAGNPGGLNTEADFLQDGWTVLMPGGIMANQWSNATSLPFSFQFFGQSVTSLRASANGIVTFQASPGTAPGANAALPAALPGLSIACFWEEFSTAPPTGSNDQVQTKVFGTAPNRQFWIRWYSFEWGASSFSYVAVVLEETSHKVYLVDQYGSLTSNWVTSTIGLQKDATFAVQVGNAANPLSGAGSGVADNSYYTFTPYVIPPYDLVPVAVTAPAGEDCGMGQEVVKATFSNIGQQAATGVMVSFSVDGGPATTEPLPGTLAPGASVEYTFAAPANLSLPGNHTLTVWAALTGDGNTANDTISTQVKNISLITSFPYTENFENGGGGWEAGGISSSWELGIPAKIRIQGAASGQKAWVTGRTTPYNPLEKSWVISPCFNLASVPADTWITLKAWWESEGQRDGAAIQGSADGGVTWITLGSPALPDWYNSNAIIALPGNQSNGWSGLTGGGASPGTWVPLTCKIPASLIGQGAVRFRIIFASDASQQYDGFAFDDITIGTPPVLTLGPDGYYCDSTVITAGAQGYLYTWSAGTTGHTITLINQTGATIFDSMLTVLAVQANGLFRRDTLRFSMTAPITSSLVSTSPVRCAGTATGAANVSVSGGLPPYSYAWSNGNMTQDPSGLAVGTYGGIVTDGLGCQQALPVFTITEPPPIGITAQVSHVRCYGDYSGSISVQTDGGTGAYTYQWSIGSTQATLDSVAAGAYTLIVTDANNCTRAETFRIEQPDSLQTTAQLMPAACEASQDGRITLIPAGGTGPYTAIWSQGSTGLVADGLAPGSYFATVMDGNGCSFTTESYDIVFQDSLPVAAFVYELNGGRVAFTNTSRHATQYVWDFGDGVSTSTASDPVFVYAQNDSFTVRLIATGPCGRDTSYAGFRMTQVSIGQSELAGSLELYPNPATGPVWLLLQDIQLSRTDLQLTGPDGRLYWSRPYAALSGSVEIPVTGLASGVYFLRIVSDGLYQTLPLIIP